MTKRKRSFSASLVLAGIILMRFVMRRVRPSAMIRGRAQQTAKALNRVGLDEAVFKLLPRQSFHANGYAMEPMNLIFVGSEEGILHSFLAAGWHEADPVNSTNLVKAYLAIILNRQYLTGPVTPLFVDDRIQTMAFQKSTKINKFRQRHHARIWSTTTRDINGHPIWIAHASYDVAIKADGIFRFPPTHRIDGNIDKERDLVVEDLTQVKAKFRGYVQFQNAFEEINAFNDPYFTDGRAAILEVARVA